MAKQKRRGNHEGCVRKRTDGRWEARVPLGVDPASGRMKYQFLYAKTREDVIEKLLEVQSQIINDDYVAPSDITVGQWLNKWLELYIKGHRKPRTFSTYEQLIRCNINPVLGTIRLQRLTCEQVQRFLNETSGKMAASTVHTIAVVLKAAFKKAITNGLLRRNVASDVTLPQIHNEKADTLTPADVKRIIEVLPDTTEGRLLEFIARTGLRLGEASALRWSDILHDSFTINQSVSWLPQTEQNQDKPVSNDSKSDKQKRIKPVFNTPKSESGIRTLPLNDAQRRILDKQRMAQTIERIQLGNAWPEYDIVFATPLGLPVRHETISRLMKRALEAAGLPAKFTPHDLRHAWATAAMASGCNAKMVSSMLGHSSVTFTLNRYTHPDLAAKRQLMERMFNF